MYKFINVGSVALLKHMPLKYVQVMGFATTEAQDLNLKC